MQAQNELIAAGLPANWTAEFTYDFEARTVYILLDKESLWVILVAFQGSIVADAFTNTPTFFPMLVNPKQSPRYTGWKDPAGVKRAAAPSDKKGASADFSGASGLFAAAQGLLAYSDALSSAGRLRDAGIVKFAYDQIFNLSWTVTEAFDYLRKNHLV